MVELELQVDNGRIVVETSDEESGDLVPPRSGERIIQAADTLLRGAIDRIGSLAALFQHSIQAACPDA